MAANRGEIAIRIFRAATEARCCSASASRRLSALPTPAPPKRRPGSPSGPLPRLLRWTSRRSPSTPRRTLTRCTGCDVQTAPRVLSAPSHPCRPSRKDQGGRGLSGGAGQVACRRIPVGGGDCADRKGLQRAEIRMREQRAESRLSAAVLHRRTTSTPSTQARDKTRRRPGSTAFVLRLCFLFRLRLLERGPVCRRVDAQPHRHCLLHA